VAAIAHRPADSIDAPLIRHHRGLNVCDAGPGGLNHGDSWLFIAYDEVAAMATSAAVKQFLTDIFGLKH